jgi:hypothetical protein
MVQGLKVQLLDENRVGAYAPTFYEGCEEKALFYGKIV